MNSIKKIVENKVAAMVDNGDINTLIEIGIEKAIAGAIESQFKSYGSITKAIEETISEGLQVDLSDLPFESYNAQMMVLIKTKLSNMFKHAAADRFLAEMDKILMPAPKEMELGKLLEVIAETWKTDEPWCCHDLDERMSVEIENSDVTDGIHVKIWKQKETGYSSTRTNSSDFDLYINKEGVIRINHNQGFNPTCFDPAEALIFKLYAAGTIITGIHNFDVDNWELTLIDYEGH